MATSLNNNGVTYNSGLTQHLAVETNVPISTSGVLGEIGNNGNVAVFIPINQTQFVVIESDTRGTGASTFSFANTYSNFGTSNVKFRKGTYRYVGVSDTGGTDNAPFIDISTGVFASNTRWSHTQNSDITLDIYSIGVLTNPVQTGNVRMLANGIQFHTSNNIQGQGLNTNVNLVANVGWQRIGNVLMLWGTMLGPGSDSKILVSLPVPVANGNWNFMITPHTSATDTGGRDFAEAVTWNNTTTQFTKDVNGNITGWYMSVPGGSTSSWMFMAPIAYPDMTPEGGNEGIGT